MRVLLIIVLMCSWTFSGSKKEDIEKRDIIMKYIVNDRMAIMSDGFFQKQISDSKGDFPNIPDSIWVEVYDSLDEKETLLNASVEIYKKQFTLLELREIKAAFEMPAMKKLMVNDEGYNHEFGMMGMRCGREICERIADYLKRKGYVNPSNSK